MGKTLDLGRLANILSLDGSGNITVTTNLILSSITQDDALTQVVVRDGTTGQFKYRDVSTIVGVSSNIYTSNGSLTANRTLTGAGYTLTFTGLGAGTAVTDDAFKIANNDNTRSIRMLGDGTWYPDNLNQTLGKIGFNYWKYGHFDGGMVIGNNDNAAVTGVGTAASIDWTLYNTSASGNIEFKFTSGQTRTMSVRSNGEVWIAPAAWSDKGDYKLQVDGGAYINGLSVINATGYQNWTYGLYVKNTDGGANEYGFAVSFYSDAGGPNRLVNIGPVGAYTGFNPTGSWSFQAEVGVAYGIASTFHSDWQFRKLTSNTAGTRWKFYDETGPAAVIMSMWSDSKNVTIGNALSDAGYRLDVDGTVRVGTTLYINTALGIDNTVEEVMVRDAAGVIKARTILSIIEEVPEQEVVTYGTF